jgi:hypothetical protein
MSEPVANDAIEDVSPGDIIVVDRGSGAQPYKVVFKDPADATLVVTFENDEGETFQLDFAAGTTVQRFPESKWESPQSPTPHV